MLSGFPGPKSFLESSKSPRQGKAMTSNDPSSVVHVSYTSDHLSWCISASTASKVDNSATSGAVARRGRLAQTRPSIQTPPNSTSTLQNHSRSNGTGTYPPTPLNPTQHYKIIIPTGNDHCALVNLSILHSYYRKKITTVEPI